MSLGIPKTIGHIWIGHRQAPTEWMESWKKLHPNWTYKLYDNEYLFSRRWRTQKLINAFFKAGEYAGVSDLMRYEILYEEGGFLPEADSICLRPTDRLWKKSQLYTVYENEKIKPGFVSPFLASAPGHPFLQRVMMRAKRRNDPANLRPAWQSVGNKFLKKAIEDLAPTNLRIFPSHYFIPQHKNSPRYIGKGNVFCEQNWGSTFGRYQDIPGADPETVRQDLIARLEAGPPPKPVAAPLHLVA